jgi:hypothetical protein
VTHEHDRPLLPPPLRDQGGDVPVTVGIVPPSPDRVVEAALDIDHEKGAVCSLV